MKLSNWLLAASIFFTPILLSACTETVEPTGSAGAAAQSDGVQPRVPGSRSDPASAGQSAAGQLHQEALLTGELDPTSWQSINGAPSSLSVTEAGIEFSARQSGISTDWLAVEPGEQIRQVFSGHVIEPGAPDIGAPFPVGPIILNAQGEVAAWWSGEAGARAAAEAGADGYFEAERTVIVPEGGTRAHMAFHGPWLRDQPNPPGRIRIAAVRLERVANESPEE